MTKTLYWLKQGLWTWYEILKKFQQKNDFKRGNVGMTLYIKKIKNDILIVQIYVDNIIFFFQQMIIHVKSFLSQCKQNLKWVWCKQ